MPLLKVDLEKEFKTIFSEQNPPNIAAQKMAAAYDKYCQKGIAGGAKPVFTGSEVKKLEGILFAAIASPVGAPPILAAAWAAGIQAYWLTPPVVFQVVPIVGVASVMPGAVAVPAIMTAGFANILNTEDMIAKIMATTLDTATKTLMVTFTAPPPPAGPPPPTLLM